jgi:hypothetical protein
MNESKLGLLVETKVYEPATSKLGLLKVTRVDAPSTSNIDLLIATKDGPPDATKVVAIGGIQDTTLVMEARVLRTRTEKQV